MEGESGLGEPLISLTLPVELPFVLFGSQVLFRGSVEINVGLEIPAVEAV